MSNITFGEFTPAADVQPSDILPLQRGATGAPNSTYVKTTVQEVAEYVATQVPGVPGESAYQVWLDAGNTGTEQDYLNSLKGTASLYVPKSVYANYTLQTGDNLERQIRALSSLPITITIPSDSSVSIPIGTYLPIIQAGSGKTTIAAASGVQLTSPETFSISKQLGQVFLHKLSTNNWEITGDLEAGINNPYAISLIARMTNKPDLAHQKAIQRLFARIQKYIPRLDTFKKAGADSQQTLLDWINPAYDGVVFLAAGGNQPIHTPYRGFKRDNVNFYITQGGYKPTPGVTKAQRNSCSAGGAIDSLGQAANIRRDRTIMGGYHTNSLPTEGYIRLSPDGSGFLEISTSLATSGAQVTTRTDLVGMWAVSRTASDSYVIYKDGVEHQRYLDASAEFNMSECVLYAMSASNGLTYNHSDTGNRFWFTGAGFTSGEINDIYYAVNEYDAYLGIDTLKVPPPAEIMLSMSPNNPVVGSTVTYKVALTNDDMNGSFRIVRGGDLTDTNFNTPFYTALATAVAATPGVTFDGIDRLSFETGFSGSITWSHTIISAAVGNTITIESANPLNFKERLPFACLIVDQPAVTAMPFLRGMNPAGGEFSSGAFYPTPEIIDYNFARKANVFRVPHDWDRLQPTIFGSLDTNAGFTGQADRYKSACDNILSKGVWCIADCHEFGGRNVNGVSYVLNSPQLPVRAFLDYWLKLANFMGAKTKPKLILNLMNEPRGMSAALTRDIMKCTVDYLRANGFANHIHVSGNTDAAGWLAGGNGAAFVDFFDPLNNFAYDVHQYLDTNKSGTEGVCTVGSKNNAQPFVTWAQQATGRKGFLGEYGWGDSTITANAQCAIEGPALLDNIENNKLVWTGHCWWAGGAFPDTYFSKLERVPLTATPDTKMMQQIQPYWDMNP